jgi:predicted PhzF superfamily epimerase YddE/YHI9
VRCVPELTVLRVFTGDDGQAGNPLGVFVEGRSVEPERRQAVAADLGFSETVFVDDAESGAIAIHTPAVELDFAGHPTVGAAWLLAERGTPVHSLRPPAGELPVRLEDDLAFVAARPQWGPQYEFEELGSAAEVEALHGPPGGRDLVGTYAFMDENAGLVRARVFPVRLGVPEDEATGGAAVQLCARLGRAIDIRQGRGSRILARPLSDGRVEIGGRVALEDVRPYRSSTSGTDTSSKRRG